MFYIWIGKKFDSKYQEEDEAITAAKEIEEMGYAVDVLNDDAVSIYKSEV